MQFQADLLRADVVRSGITETTALGAAFLAGLSTGFWKGIDELRSLWQAGVIFSPEMQPGVAETLVGGWHRAVRAAGKWADDH